MNLHFFKNIFTKNTILIFTAFPNFLAEKIISGSIFLGQNIQNSISNTPSVPVKCLRFSVSVHYNLTCLLGKPVLQVNLYARPNHVKWTVNEKLKDLTEGVFCGEFSCAYNATNRTQMS